MDDLEKARHRRDSAFSVQIVDMDRDGEIAKLVSLPDGLYTVSQRAIHRTQLADMIDPEFAHPNTPHVNQRFANAGADNPIVCRTFLQADRLFRKPYFDVEKCGQVMNIVLAGMQEMLGAEEILKRLQDNLRDAEEDLPKRHEGVFSLPEVGTVEGRGKTFVQRAEHALQAIFQLAVLVLGDTCKQGFFDGVAAHVRANFGEDENFVTFADSMSTFAKLIRGLRHSIEHRRTNQEIDFLDYHFASGQLHQPIVCVTHPDVPFDRMPLNDFMIMILTNLVEALETMIVYLAASKLTSFGKVPIAVGQDPQFGQGNVLVRYTYLIAIGEPPEWHPLS